MRNETVQRIQDLLWDAGAKNVFGLPCVCSTPELHSDDCVAVRRVAQSVMGWQRRMERKASTARAFRRLGLNPCDNPDDGSGKPGASTVERENDERTAREDQ